MTGDIRETAIDHVAGEKIATFFSSETKWINQIGGDIPPGSQHVFQVDVHFGHHLRVEDRDQDDGRPDHHVEQVFTDSLFFLDFHASNIVKVAGKAKLV